MNGAPQASGGGSPRIRYETTLDDLQAFALHASTRSDAARRARRKLTWALPLLMLAMFGAVALVTRELRYLAVAAVIAPLWALLVPRLHDKGLALQIRRQLATGDHEATLGPRELELTEDELVERGAHGVRRTRLAAIDRIVTEGGRTFVVVGPTAHVISHAAVTEGDRQAFFAALAQHLAAVRT